MEGSGPQNGERRARRSGIVIGLLVALVIALAVALAVVVIGDDSDDEETSATTPTVPTQTQTTAPTQSTSTQPTVTTTSPSTPTTRPVGPTIDQIQAKAAARRGASQEVRRMGIGLPPSEWDVRCTALGGTNRSRSWSCQVASNSGQCAGSISVVARAPGVATTRNPRIACGE